MVIRELVATLGLDFVSGGFEAAEKAFDELNAKATAAFGVIGAGIAALTALTVTTASHTAKLKAQSDALGLNVEDYQRLVYAADTAGVSMDDLSEGLKAAAKGGKLQSGQVLELADRLKGISDKTERARIATELMGQAGVKLLPFLAKGSDGILKLAREADELGVTMAEETVESLDDFDTAMTDLGTSVARVKAAIVAFGHQLAARFAPLLKTVVDGVRGIVDAIVRWYVAHKELIGVISGYVVQAFGHTLELLWFAITNVVDGVLALLSTLKKVHPALLAFGAAAALIGLSIASPAVAVLALSAAIIGLIDDIMVFAKGGKSVLGDLLDWAGGLLGIENGADRARVFFKDMFKDFGGKVGVFVADARAKLTDWWNWLVDKIKGAKDLLRAVVPKGSEGAIGDFLGSVAGSAGGAYAGSKLGGSVGKMLFGDGMGETLGNLLGSAAGAYFGDKAGRSAGTYLGELAAGSGEKAAEPQAPAPEPAQTGIGDLLGRFLGGGAESPQAAAAVASPPGSTTSTTNVGGPVTKQVTASQTNNITVNVPPGTPHEDIEHRVVAVISDWWNGQMQDAHADMTDGVPAGVGQ